MGLPKVEKIEYETYYCFCPYCEWTNDGLTDDTSEIINCRYCLREFKIK